MGRSLQFALIITLRLFSLGSFFDPQMLTIRRDPYASPATILFQRLTVIITDIVLFWAISFYCQADKDEEEGGAPSSAPTSPTTPKPVHVSNVFVSSPSPQSSSPAHISSITNKKTDVSTPTPIGGVLLPTPQAFQDRRTLTIVCKRPRKSQSKLILIC
jgi:hypothetical protein